MNVICVFLCVSSCPEGAVHHTVAEVVRFVEDRIKGEDDKDSRALRGPYLARLELIHRLRERGCPEEAQLGKKHTEREKKLFLFFSVFCSFTRL